MNAFLPYDTILIAGHRGAAALFPENTAVSFKAAIDMGVDMLETDLRLTADKQIAVIHDERVDRTTNGTGLVRAFTLEQLQTLDAGSHFHPRFTGQHILSLQEFCKLVISYPHLLLNIEIKDDSHELVDLALLTFRRYQLTGRCVFASFHPSVLAYLHDAYGVRTQGFPKEYFDKNFTDGPDGTYSKMYASGIGMDTLTPARAEETLRMNIQPWAWCPDTAEEVEYCISCGVKLITCNNPLPAIKLLR